MSPPSKEEKKHGKPFARVLSSAGLTLSLVNDIVHVHVGKKQIASDEFLFRASVRDNQTSRAKVSLQLRFDEYVVPVIASQSRYRLPTMSIVGSLVPIGELTQGQAARLESIRRADPLTKLTRGDEDLLWMCRHALARYAVLFDLLFFCV